MLYLVISSLVVLQYASAQGPMFKTDPTWSPPPSPNATLVFGDIAFTAEQAEAYKKGSITFNAIIGQQFRWKNAIIPYKIDCSIENLADATSAVDKAMRQWERKTCIRFVKWTDQKYFVTFFRNTHCWGNVGQVRDSHISVGPGCEYEHVMAHEIGHVIGLYHEQNRKDRDNWVKVHWENIGQFRSAFDIVQNTDPLGIQYDYESIMHYPWNAFSSNGKKTMSPIRDTHGKIPYIEISKDDITLVSRMYKCPVIEMERSLGAVRTRRRVSNFDKWDCVDKNPGCEEWARKGKCARVESIRILCKRSCQAASCFGGPCIDLHKDCPLWKKLGHCKFVEAVQADCQKSCNPQCHGPPTAPPITTAKPRTKPTTTEATEAPWTRPTRRVHTISTGQGRFHQWPNRNYLGIGARCFDRNPGCPAWAKSGECERNKGWMLRNCRKSCPEARCDRYDMRPTGTRCNEPLGLSIDPDGKHRIPDSAMTATSQLSPGAGWHAAARNARLYFEDDYKQKRIGAWCVGNHEKNQHIDVDLQETKTITYIATQGRDKYWERVSEFKIAYSDDGRTYTTFKENGKERIFYGNCDHVTPILNKFEGYIRARYVRYIPVYWNWPCVRMEFYGC